MRTTVRGERWIVLGLRLMLGLLFVWAAHDKILNPKAFALAVANYRILPDPLVNLFALILPWVELICGLLLLTGQWTRSASLLVAFLLVVFVIAVSINLARGLDISCGCFHTSEGRTIGARLLVEDLLFFLMAIFLTFRAKDATGWSAFLEKRRRAL